MKNYEQNLSRLHKNLCYALDREIRRKGEILREALRSRNFRKTAVRFGVSRKILYDWLNRLRVADFELNGLTPHEKFYGKKTARQVA